MLTFYNLRIEIDISYIALQLYLLDWISYLRICVSSYIEGSFEINISSLHYCGGLVLSYESIMITRIISVAASFKLVPL